MTIEEYKRDRIMRKTIDGVEYDTKTASKIDFDNTNEIGLDGYPAEEDSFERYCKVVQTLTAKTKKTTNVNSLSFLSFFRM